MRLPAPWAASQRAWRLSARAYRSDGLSRRVKQNLRWALIAALRSLPALDWFARTQSRLIRPFAQANPLLPLKPLRVYLSARWNLLRRIKVMRDTYAFVQWRGGAVRRALLQADGSGVPLATLGEEGPEALHLRLGRDNRFRKEGEFAILLDAPAWGGRICSLAFALEWQRDRGLTVYAGCVQGRSEGDEAIMKPVQKLLHGMRPKALVVFAVQEVARALGARELLGAGNAIQVHRRKHFIHLPWLHDLTFDYDAFWAEMGGERAEDGWFYLPRHAHRRSRDEIKPNKRSQYAKRYALLDDLSRQIREAMAPKPPGGV